MFDTKAIADLLLAARTGTVNIKPNALKLRGEKKVYEAESLEKLQDAITSHGKALTALLGVVSQTFGSGRFVDRGDPATVDWDESTLTIDGAWHDLDLSSIVPVGAVAVVLHVTAYNDTSFLWLAFRKKGNTRAWNSGSIYGFSDIPSACDLVVSLDSNRMIQYMGSNPSGANWCPVVVGGWWSGASAAGASAIGPPAEAVALCWPGSAAIRFYISPAMEPFRVEIEMALETWHRETNPDGSPTRVSFSEIATAAQFRSIDFKLEPLVGVWGLGMYPPPLIIEPMAGDVTIDSGQDWDDAAFRSSYLLALLIHEVGHALGLGENTTEPASVMNPVIAAGRINLAAIDKSMLLALYGT
jgi:hypothetical protein